VVDEGEDPSFQKVARRDAAPAEPKTAALMARADLEKGDAENSDEVEGTSAREKRPVRRQGMLRDVVS